MICPRSLVSVSSCNATPLTSTVVAAVPTPQLQVDALTPAHFDTDVACHSACKARRNGRNLIRPNAQRRHLVVAGPTRLHLGRNAGRGVGNGSRQRWGSAHRSCPGWSPPGFHCHTAHASRRRHPRQRRPQGTSPLQDLTFFSMETKFKVVTLHFVQASMNEP